MKHRFLTYVLILLAACGSIYGLVDTYLAIHLNSTGKIISARVTEKAVHYSQGKDYVIRYKFYVGGAVYGASDAFGRPDLWTSLTKERWEAIAVNDEVAVRYLDGRPSVNRLIERGSGIADAIVLTTCSFFLMVVGIEMRRRARWQL